MLEPNQRHFSGGLLPDPRNYQDKPQPKEPSLLTCAQELRGYLYELGKIHADTRSQLFQPEPSEIRGNGSEETGDTLEGVLRHSCRLAACLVGEARSINARLIG